MNEDIDALAIAVPIVQGSKLAVAVGQALSLAKIDTGTGSIDNPVLEVKDNCKVRLVRSVRLTGNQFYMINDSGNSVPLIVQENKAEAEMTSKAGGSDYEHDTDRWEFGMKRVGNGGFGRFADVVQIPLT